MRTTSNLVSLATRNSSSHSSEDYKCKVCNQTRPALNASLAASQLKVQIQETSVGGKGEVILFRRPEIWKVGELMS